MLLYHLYDNNHNVLSEIWADNLNSAMHIANTNFGYLRGYYVKKENLSGKWLLE